MKSQYVKIKNMGMCILISDIDGGAFNDLNSVFGGQSFRNSRLFRNVDSIADEFRGSRKIAAIKEIRTQTGWGLKESKEYSDKYVPIGSPDDFDYEAAADKFIRDHTNVIEAEFVSSDEMEII